MEKKVTYAISFFFVTVFSDICTGIYDTVVWRLQCKKLLAKSTFKPIYRTNKLADSNSTSNSSGCKTITYCRFLSKTSYDSVHPLLWPPSPVVVSCKERAGIVIKKGQTWCYAMKFSKVVDHFTSLRQKVQSSILYTSLINTPIFWTNDS